MTFECGFSGTTQSPSWNIDGKDYYTSELQSPHMYDASSMSLIISPVEKRLNNSVYYCFFVTYSEEESRFVRISSDHAVLIIPLIIHTMSQQKSSDSVSVHNIVPTHTISVHLISTTTTTTAIQYQSSFSHAKSPKFTAKSTVQCCATSTVPSVTSNLTAIIDCVSNWQEDRQNLAVQGFN